MVATSIQRLNLMDQRLGDETYAYMKQLWANTPGFVHALSHLCEAAWTQSCSWSFSTAAHQDTGQQVLELACNCGDILCMAHDVTSHIPTLHQGLEALYLRGMLAAVSTTLRFQTMLRMLKRPGFHISFFSTELLRLLSIISCWKRPEEGPPGQLQQEVLEGGQGVLHRLHVVAWEALLLMPSSNARAGDIERCRKLASQILLKLHCKSLPSADLHSLT